MLGDPLGRHPRGLTPREAAGPSGAGHNRESAGREHRRAATRAYTGPNPRPVGWYSAIQIGIAAVVVGFRRDRRAALKKERPRRVTGGAKLSYMQQPARRAGKIEPTAFRHRMSLPPSIKEKAPRSPAGLSEVDRISDISAATVAARSGPAMNQSRRPPLPARRTHKRRGGP